MIAARKLEPCGECGCLEWPDQMEGTTVGGFPALVCLLCFARAEEPSDDLLAHIEHCQCQPECAR